MQIALSQQRDDRERKQEALYILYHPHSSNEKMEGVMMDQILNFNACYYALVILISSARVSRGPNLVKLTRLAPVDGPLGSPTDCPNPFRSSAAIAVDLFN